MRKSLLGLSFMILVGASSNHVAAQANTRTPALTGIKNQNTSISSAPSPAPASTNPNTDAKVLFEEGMKQTEAGQYSEAAESFRQALRLDPEFADAYAALGQAYFRMRQWQNAIDNLNRASALRAKQREANALKQTVSIKKKEEPVARVNGNPGSLPEAKPKQATNVTPVAKKSPLTSVPNQQSAQRKETSSPVQAISTKAETKLPQVTNANVAAVNRRPADSHATPQLEPAAAGDVLPFKGDNGKLSEQKHEPEGARVSLNVTPSSRPVETTSVNAILTEPPSAEVSATTIYRVGPNDVLDIHLSGSNSPQSTLFTITPSGLLEHPMLPEPLMVMGFTADEIGTKIENELKKLELIQNPKVIVGVRDYASHAILVSGLVKDPGTRFLRREAVPLYVVVADAQALPEAARIMVVRNELKQIYEMELSQAADMNFLVHPGDVVTMNPNITQFIYIGGEVKSPGEKTFRRGLTLMQTIIAAGGAAPKSKTAEIGRDDGRGFLVETKFDLRSIRSGKAADPLLRPGDRIMVVR